jgi:hypothetical protein
MEQQQSRRLIVFSRNKRLGGIVSLEDFVMYRQGKKVADETLSEILKAA